ncbi:hypothetical protein HK102_007417, partial [Quaeritorhiza haematococci]
MEGTTSALNKKDDPELKSLSVVLDGRASVEHQIDIHVLDLVDVATNKDLSLSDILQGLKYVMDYRIKGGKMPHLDRDLMRRLLESLLSNMAGKQGSILAQTPTEDADLAFELFGEFLEEVEEFRQCVGEKSTTDLRHALKIHRRCQPSSKEEQKENAAGILALLTTRFPQFQDWRELVKEREHDDVERLMKNYEGTFKEPNMPPTEGNIYPPPALYFDKSIEALALMFSTSLKNGLPSTKIPDLTAHY